MLIVVEFLKIQFTSIKKQLIAQVKFAKYRILDRVLFFRKKNTKD